MYQSSRVIHTTHRIEAKDECEARAITPTSSKKNTPDVDLVKDSDNKGPANKEMTGSEFALARTQNIERYKGILNELMTGDDNIEGEAANPKDKPSEGGKSGSNVEDRGVT